MMGIKSCKFVSNCRVELVSEVIGGRTVVDKRRGSETRRVFAIYNYIVQDRPDLGFAVKALGVEEDCSVFEGMPQKNMHVSVAVGDIWFHAFSDSHGAHVIKA